MICWFDLKEEKWKPNINKVMQSQKVEKKKTLNCYVQVRTSIFKKKYSSKTKTENKNQLIDQGTKM